MQTQNAIISGSLSAIATQNNRSIAETFVSCDAILLIDTSGSMDQKDSRGGKSRYAVACEEMNALQVALPGKIGIIAFSSDVSFCPSGIATFYGGGTDLAKALKFMKTIDSIPGEKFVLISDGQPDSPSEALDVAKTYKNPISVIYVGPESNPQGRQFLQKLASVTGGKTVTADRAKELSATIQKLMLTTGK
jgi:Mg-chelatase subunit ChlD